MDVGFWAKALAISSSLGFAVALIARFVPFIPNKVVPKLGYVTILLTNIGLLWQKFLESAGWATASLMPLPDDTFGVAIVYAGFFAFLKPILLIAQPVLVSFIQYVVNRWAHEGGVKPVVENKEPVQVVLNVKSTESPQARMA